jgi:hypothetical protein
MSTHDRPSPSPGPEAAETEPQLFPLLDGYWEALLQGEGDTEHWLGQHPEGSDGLRDLRLLEALHRARAVLGEDSRQLLERDGLWPLLVLLTARKVLRLPRPIDPDQDPEFATQVAEECRRLLDLLTDPELQAVALWKVAGCTNQEIAARLDRAAPAVERKLRAIRTIWEKEGPP